MLGRGNILRKNRDKLIYVNNKNYVAELNDILFIETPFQAREVRSKNHVEKFLEQASSHSSSIIPSTSFRLMFSSAFKKLRETPIKCNTIKFNFVCIPRYHSFYRLHANPMKLLLDSFSSLLLQWIFGNFSVQSFRWNWRRIVHRG